MVDSIRALDPACLPLYGMSFFCSNVGFSHITGISCQQHTIPAHPRNIHIQPQQKLGGKYDICPGFRPEPGGDPPGLLPADKAGGLEVAEEVSMVVELVQAIVTVQIIEHIMAVVLDMCIHPILLLIIHQGAY